MPSKQRSYRIALSKQAISQTSGCARLDEVSATAKKNKAAKNSALHTPVNQQNKIQNYDTVKMDMTP